jgi:predicted restriction endonuclease
MRSELNELALIDGYLFRQLDQQQTQMVETSILLNNTFAEKVEAQRQAHRLIRLYARTQERQSLENIYQRLLNEPAFANQLKSLI